MTHQVSLTPPPRNEKKGENIGMIFGRLLPLPLVTLMLDVSPNKRQNGHGLPFASSLGAEDSSGSK
jgi:hypothetical protein